MGNRSQRTEPKLPIYRHAETKLPTQFPQLALGHALDVWQVHLQSGAVVQKGISMSRNFGLPRQADSGYRGPIWPLVALTLIMIGLIDVATHLHHW
ncbi:hypothetical protein [Bradyrhizobium erythrophlei]|uniref:Uncharacterized protein n=1 Tax=Bradyrhizobium erythrophlei TaxID=1437360 RepID=A0A1M5R1D8_9BRAD|nr:hypothetical protein [Bradyrhizobium erythrophlei]SHH19988.1 hypothetical protein SAMN05444169_6282 [Bradyrhizobium erythrophlei]